MGKNITVYTTYLSGSDFGGRLEVSKFSVRRMGTKGRLDRMQVGFEGKGDIKRAWMYLDSDIAIPLARSLLSVTEGYITESVSEVA